MKMAKADKNRFFTTYEQTAGFSGRPTVIIFADKITGVQYISNLSNNGCGLTLLVDQDGKPLLYQPPEGNK